jgi:hypothetical protein
LGTIVVSVVVGLGHAQVQGQEQAPQQTPQTLPQQTPPPNGKVIFQKDDKTDAVTDADSEDQKVPADSSSSSSSSPQPVEKAGPADADVIVSDEEREAIAFTAYDLDVHLKPATAAIEAHTNFTVRNDGKVPLTRVAVQLSSSLAWESLRVKTGAAGSFVQHRINTDADHTGVAREAVLTLPQPLAPGATVALTGFYAGRIAASAERLERIGAPEDQAAQADWDAVGSKGGVAAGTALRGYGDVLWYPVAGAPVFLGDGAKLFDAVGRAKQRQQRAMTRLRLTIAYTGEAPDAAYFCGRREPLTISSENDGLPVAQAPGIATAEFGPRALGFRVPSLFVTEKAATMTDGGLMQAVTDNSDALERYTAAAAKVQPLLMDWLGNEPLGALEMIDHAGQPFEDGALLVAPLRVAEPAALAPMMVHTLAHSWFGSSHAWLDEGVAQFMSLLWVETNDGRQAGVDRLQSASEALALAEPAPGRKDAGQSLVEASSEVYYRTKAAAVLWMLRGIVGDDALKKALQAYRKNKAADASAEGFQEVLEETSGKDVQWFFDDWVYRDKGLPDLSIAHVSPRPLPEKGGKSDGWLVAVDVRNDGDAVAEVPVTVRSGTLTATERLRIPGRSDAATRILFQGTPAEVVVNDGSVPEAGQSLHIKKVAVKDE